MLLFNYLSLNAQVGIGTTAPQSLLDINITDRDNPLPNDGLLVPRVNVFPTTDPGADQDGMLVYLTTDLSPFSKGFHYWDFDNTTWRPIDTDTSEWSRSGDYIYANQAQENGVDITFSEDGDFGIGTATPVEKIEIRRSGDNDMQFTSANSNPPNVIFYNSGGTIDAPDLIPDNREIGSLVFKTHNGAAIREVGGVRMFMDGATTASSLPTKFVVNTTQAGTTNQVERFTIKNDGNTGIGENDPQEKLHVAGTIRSDALNTANNPTASYPTQVYADADGNLSLVAPIPPPAAPSIVATGLIAGDGTSIKINGATVTFINTGDYQVTFNTARPTANYIINLTTIDCGGNCGGTTYDDPGIAYYDRTTTGFKVNIGDSDNGTTAKVDINLEFSFSVIDF